MQFNVVKTTKKPGFQKPGLSKARSFLYILKIPRFKNSVFFQNFRVFKNSPFQKSPDFSLHF